MKAFDPASKKGQGEDLTNIVKFPLETNYNDTGAAEIMKWHNLTN